MGQCHTGHGNRSKHHSSTVSTVVPKYDEEDDHTGVPSDQPQNTKHGSRRRSRGGVSPSASAQQTNNLRKKSGQHPGVGKKTQVTGISGNVTHAPAAAQHAPGSKQKRSSHISQTSTSASARHRADPQARPALPGPSKPRSTGRLTGQLEGVIDPDDILSALDERLEHVVNTSFSPPEMLRIQRSVRAAARSVRGASTGGFATAVSGGREKGIAGSKAALQKQLVDDLLLRRIFSDGVAAYSEGGGLWFDCKKYFVDSGGDTSTWKDKTRLGDGVGLVPDASGGTNQQNHGSELQQHEVSSTLDSKDYTYHTDYPVGKSNLSLSTHPTSTSSKHRPDPVGSFYLLLLSLSEARWNAYAAAAGAVTAAFVRAKDGVVAVGSNVSKDNSPKKLIRRSLSASSLRSLAQNMNGSGHGAGHGSSSKFRGDSGGGVGPGAVGSLAGGDHASLSADGGGVGAGTAGGGTPSSASIMSELDVPLPPGISFLGLSFGMGIALRGNRSQKLVLLFHILVPPKQLKALFSQSNFFPSYVFELGHLGSGISERTASPSPSLIEEEKLLSVSSKDIQPDKHYGDASLRVDRRLALDAIGSLVAVSTLRGDAVHQRIMGDSDEVDEDLLHKVARLCTNKALLLHLLLQTTSTAFTGGTGKDDDKWTYTDFVQWANHPNGRADDLASDSNGSVLDDVTLDRILEVLFSWGILPSPDEEMELVRTRWREWSLHYEVRMERIRRYLQGTGDGRGFVDDNDVGFAAVFGGWKEVSGALDNNGGTSGGVSTSGSNRKKFGIWNALSFSSLEHQPSSTSVASNDLGVGAGVAGAVADPRGVGAGESSTEGEVDKVKSAQPAPLEEGWTAGGNGGAAFSVASQQTPVWGGLGNFDGGGGLGYGLMYCVEKSWWDSWLKYTTQNVFDSSLTKMVTSRGRHQRRLATPPTLSNQSLVLNDSASVVNGTLGSYEQMKPNLVQNEDFVLVPPGVWDLLYELYGGGPPLPRMVVQQNGDGETNLNDGGADALNKKKEAHESTVDKSALETESNEGDEAFEGGGFVVDLSLPREIRVLTHPWVLHCQICDPLQPYRRGDAGSLSIRVQCSPDQPFWRFFAELVLRLPIHASSTRPFRGKDPQSLNGAGRARLWKRLDVALMGGVGKEGVKDSLPAGACRYGPWSLLCKGRHASFPIGAQLQSATPPLSEADLMDYEQNWKAYADHGSVESVGLSDGMRVMFEYAVTAAKEGCLTWPREAAAKAGRVRRLAEEDASFRLKLRGIDQRGRLSGDSLEGLVVDAMDSTGRWYQAEIVQVERKGRVRPHVSDERSHDVRGETMDDGSESTAAEYGDEAESEDEPDCDAAVRRTPSNVSSSSAPSENFRIRVDFGDMGFHEEWIDVNSDRLAIAGRYTLDSMKSVDGSSRSLVGSPSMSDVKNSRSSSVHGVRKVGAHNSDPIAESNGTSICPFPGYGACGLSNLGNTCYANAAIQCVGYMPLIRSYLLSGLYKINGDLNRDNPLGTGGRLLEELADLLRVLWSGKYSARAPTRFRAQLAKARSQFSGTDQQDAQELLNTIFDALHEDSNKVKKKPNVPPLDDAWVKKTSLPRVGLEAWRRYLRRNRSVIANVAMGQVLNRVKCPTCNHSSLNFDPFNMLSIPFPTIADVTFRCTILRRGTALNCQAVSDVRGLSVNTKGRIGGMPSSSAPAQSEKSRSGEQNEEFCSSATAAALPPSEHLIMEEYIVAMSRLADVGDLKLRLQNLAGIPIDRLKLCKAEECVVPSASIPEDERLSHLRKYVKVTPLMEKEGPCVQLANKSSPLTKDGHGINTALTEIVGYESTLRPREQLPEDAIVDDVDVLDECLSFDEEDDKRRNGQNGDSSLANGSRPSNSLRGRVLGQLSMYGDERECRLVDTDPTLLARAVSRRLWPKSSSDFCLGLRVDAIDQRHHWFPGSVVEVSEFKSVPVSAEKKSVIDASGASTGSGKGDGVITSRRVRVHFDNFSSRWDEWYEFSDFVTRQVQPLYSHSSPRAKPTEMIVYHRYWPVASRQKTVDSPQINSASSDGSSSSGAVLFGQPFYIQFHNEWSTARAGAHVLAQAVRFFGNPAAEKVFVNRDGKGIGTNGDSKVPVEPLQDRNRTSGDSVIGDKSDSGQSSQPSPVDCFSDWERHKLDEAVDSGRAALVEAINILLASDRQYIKLALADPGKTDAAAQTIDLSEKLRSVNRRLPFDIFICSADSPLGEGNRVSGGSSNGSSNMMEEIPFPFSFVRSVGNYLNSKSAVVLHWRNVKLEWKNKKTSPSSVMPFNSEIASGVISHVLYVEPKRGIHLHSRSVLDSSGAKASSSNRDSPSSKGPIASTAQAHTSSGMDLGVCLTEFCKEQQLSATDCWRCPKCKDVREGRQSMTLWRLPDILTFHIKRFNCSARWREKISTRINFPLTGLDMSEWCDKESPALNHHRADNESTVYDLICVVNHLGGMTGGHYVATCKATPCSVDGSEEVTHDFTGAAASGCRTRVGGGGIRGDGQTAGAMWKIPGRIKGDKEASSATQHHRVAAAAASRAASESCEPLWLQFDDDLVEPIPPKNVVSEMAYVLFYRRRQLTPSNIARYSTLD